MALITGVDLHLPNHVRPYTLEELVMAQRLQPRHLVHMVYADGVVPQHAGQLLDLEERTGADATLRMYDDRIMLRWTPEDWGRESVRRIRPYLRPGRRRRIVSNNEDNHATEGDIDDPWQLWLYWITVARVIRDELGDAVSILMPPLEPDHEAKHRELYRWLFGWHPANHFDALAMHVYPRTVNWMDVSWARERTGLEVDVLETDSLLGKDPEGNNLYMPMQAVMDRLSTEGARARCVYLLSGSAEFEWCDLMARPWLLEEDPSLFAPPPISSPEVPTVANLIDAQAAAYRLANTSVPFNPDAAITKRWLSLKKQGTYIGVPIGPEISLDDGRAAQAFTSGAVLVWEGGEEVSVQ